MSTIKRLAVGTAALFFLGFSTPVLGALPQKKPLNLEQKLSSEVKFDMWGKGVLDSKYVFDIDETRGYFDFNDDGKPDDKYAILVKTQTGYVLDFGRPLRVFYDSEFNVTGVKVTNKTYRQVIYNFQENTYKTMLNKSEAQTDTKLQEGMNFWKNIGQRLVRPLSKKHHQ